MPENPIQTESFTHRGEKPIHVTLVRPPSVSKAASINFSALTPPLALAYLSASLRRAGFGVTNVDSIGEGLDSIHKLKRNPSMEAVGLTPDATVSRIPKSTHLIGVSCMFSLEWPSTRDLVNHIRSQFPTTPIIVGGEHVTALPEASMQQCPAIDYVCLGEGDKILVAAAEALLRGENLEGLEGILYRRDGAIIRSQHLADRQKKFRPMVGEVSIPRSGLGASGIRIENLDELPWPAWDLTPIEAYLHRKLSFGRYSGVTMPIMGSRGCPYDCTFCSNPTMWGRKYLTREAKDVVDEIRFYRDRYGINAIEFYDLTPIIKRQWILDFCDELIKQDLKISWQISGGTRCEAIDEEVIVRAKASGCSYIGFAPESGSKEVLKRIKKRVDLKRMLWLVRVARKHRVDTRCNIIIGFPDDTRKQVYTSLLFNWRLALMGVVDSPIFEFSAYPGSEDFEVLRSRGVITELNDEFFENLGLDMRLTDKMQLCQRIPPWELTLYRTVGMSVFYGLYYALRPLKFLMFLKNTFHYTSSNSVFEQRIIQNIRKRFQRLLGSFRPRRPAAQDQ